MGNLFLKNLDFVTSHVELPKYILYPPFPRQYLLHLVCALLEERGYFPRLQQRALTKPPLPRATAALTKSKQQNAKLHVCLVLRRLEALQKSVLKI